MSLTGEPIVILGTFRGGTSCLSTALAAMGLYMGEADALQAASESNKGGFWELLDMQALNAEALGVYGMSYMGSDHLPDHWEDWPETDFFVARGKALLEKHFRGRPHWGWKEPGTTSLFPFYKRLLADLNLSPRFPIMVRNPLSIVSSRQRQFQFQQAEAAGQASQLLPPDEMRSMGLWLDYALANLVFSKGSPRQVIPYEALLEDPALYLGRLAPLMPWKVSDEQLEAAVATINPEWSHSRYTREDLERCPSLVQRAYDLCLRAAADPEGLNRGDFDGEIDALWQEWLETGSLVRSRRMPPGQFVVAWLHSGEVSHVSQSYTPTGGWQTLRSEVPGKPGDPVQVTLYQLPCVIWIKRAVWRQGERETPAALSQGPGGYLEKPSHLKLTSVGPGPLLTKMPEGEAPATLELEFLVHFDLNFLSEAAMKTKAHLDAARRPAR